MGVATLTPVVVRCILWLKDHYSGGDLFCHDPQHRTTWCGGVLRMRPQGREHNPLDRGAAPHELALLCNFVHTPSS